MWLSSSFRQQTYLVNFILIDGTWRKKNDSKALLNWNRRPYLESASTKKKYAHEKSERDNTSNILYKVGERWSRKKGVQNENQQHQPNDNIKRILVRNKFIGV